MTLGRLRPISIAMTGPILFVTYGGGHMHMVTAVAAALRQRPDAPAIRVMGLPAALSTLRAAGLDVFSFVDLLDKDTDADAIAWGTDLARKHHSPHTGIPLEESVAYLGLSFKDLVTRFGEDRAKALMAEKGRHAFRPVTILSRAIEKVAPSVVVATNSPRAEAAAIDAALNAGLPNIVMADLFSGMIDYPLKAADVTFLNQFAEEGFVEYGLFDASVSTAHHLGNPAFDGLLDRHVQPDLARLRQMVPGLPDAPAVLHADMPAWFDPVALAPHTKDADEIWSEMATVHAACQEARASYLIRPHPSQDDAPFKAFVAQHAGAYLAASPPLHDLIEAVDLVIARSTTVALEAVYLRQDVLQLDPETHVDLPLAQMGVAKGVALNGALASAIRSCLEDAEARSARRAQADAVLARAPAAEAIADLILDRAHRQTKDPT